MMRANAMVRLHTMLGLAALACGAGTVGAQQRVERRVAVAANASIKVWLPAGSVRLIGWDHDSLVIEGTMAKGETFAFAGAGGSVKMSVGNPWTDVKFGVADLPPGQPPRPSTLIAHVPRGSRVNVRTVDASIEGTDVSGWFNSVSGSIRLSGVAQEVQAETMDGSIDLSVSAPWVRTRTASGPLTVAGRAEDLGAATVSGDLTVTTQGLMRGRLESMTGAIIMAALPSAESSIDIDTHSGPVEVRMPADLGADFDLTSVAGTITNSLSKQRPAAGRQDRGQTLVFATDPAGPRIVVRTFKGTISLRRR
jgi:hypothetical protein